MITNEQIAHDLAIVYLVNRFGPEVDGRFDVTDGDGNGSVDTERLPDVDAHTTRRVGTGEHRRILLWRYEKKMDVETDEYQVDPIFRQMITEYRRAYARFLGFLTPSQATIDQDAAG